MRAPSLPGAPTGLLLVLLCASLPAQTVCDGRNHLSVVSSGGFGVGPGERFAIRYVSPSRRAVTSVGWFVPFDLGAAPGLAWARVEIRAHDFQTSYPGPVLVTGEVTPTSAPGWYEAPLNRPFVLDPFALYWITLHVPLGSPVRFVGYEDAPMGPDPTTHVLETGTGWRDGTIPFRFKLRVSSSDCMDAPSATTTRFGAGCVPGGVTAPLLDAPPPVVADPSFALTLSGAPPGVGVELWWTPGPRPAAPVPLFTGCDLGLDPGALFALFAAGLNPLIRTTTDVAGEARMPVPLPPDLATRGAMVTMQALVLDPAGIVLGGTPFTLSAPLELFIGY